MPTQRHYGIWLSAVNRTTVIDPTISQPSFHLVCHSQSPLYYFHTRQGPRLANLCRRSLIIEAHMNLINCRSSKPNSRQIAISKTWRWFAITPRVQRQHTQLPTGYSYKSICETNKLLLH